jgi:membrane-bound lytic murein transglycosylase D
MRIGIYRCLPVLAASLVACMLLAACATTNRPQAFRTFVLPPTHGPIPPVDPPADPPAISSGLYASEVPLLISYLPQVQRPTDAEFLIKRAEDRFNAGKRAFQEGKLDLAREEFNRAVEILLAAPDGMPDRPRVERRLEEITDNIYRYDLDRLSSADSQDQVSFDKSPRDSILEMTFPLDPSLRGKVRDQIAATASQLPLQENDAVLKYVNFFSSERGKRILVGGIRRSGRYKAIIEKALREEGLPQELIFLAQAESGFLPRAVSNKQCVGLWQFAAFRGKEYGLEQTGATDDRMDAEKATRAAARHLHDLYSHFGDWYLAMAAYDCGPGCVDHAVMRTGYADYWELRRLNVLPGETANYVPVILAMTIVAKNAKAYGLEIGDLDPPLEFDNFELQSPTHIALVAAAIDRPLSELRELNPALIRLVAPAGYTLHVPKGSREALETAFAIIPTHRRDAWRLHRVEAGDTFATLAKRYTSVPAQVASANHDSMPEVGSWAAIPVAYQSDRPARSRNTAAKTTVKSPTRRQPTAAAIKRPASTNSTKKLPTKSTSKKPA